MVSKKNIKKSSNKPAPLKNTQVQRLTILPSNGFLGFMMDIALVSLMFVAIGMIGAVAIDMIAHTFSKITITVTK